MLRSLLLLISVFTFSTHVAAQSDLGTQSKTVLVAGATGASGREIVKVLLEKGYNIRAMSRSAERAASLGEGVQPAVADVTRPASLPAVMDGVDVVISAIGGRRPIGSNGFKAVDYEGNKALIDAAKAAGVKRFLIITAGSAGRDGFLYSLPFGPYPWKARAEAHLRQSGLDYTIIAPGGLRDEPSGQTGILLTTRDSYEPASINRSDMAIVLVACMEDDTTVGKTITIINDASLPVDSWQSTLASFPKD